LGAATTIWFYLAGRVAASVAIDRFALLRVPVHELSLPRLVGAVPIVIGVTLVQRF